MRPRKLTTGGQVGPGMKDLLLGRYLFRFQKMLTLVSNWASIKRYDSQYQWSLMSILAIVLERFDPAVSTFSNPSQCLFKPKRICLLRLCTFIWVAVFGGDTTYQCKETSHQTCSQIDAILLYVRTYRPKLGLLQRCSSLQ